MLALALARRGWCLLAVRGACSPRVVLGACPLPSVTVNIGCQQCGCTEHQPSMNYQSTTRAISNHHHMYEHTISLATTTNLLYQYFRTVALDILTP